MFGCLQFKSWVFVAEYVAVEDPLETSSLRTAVILRRQAERGSTAFLNRTAIIVSLAAVLFPDPKSSIFPDPKIVKFWVNNLLQ